MAEPNYLKPLCWLLATGVIAPKPGEVRFVEVAHDDWCAIFKGEPCDCEPEIGLGPVEAKPR